MYNQKTTSRPGGYINKRGKGYNDRKPLRQTGRPDLHPATCAECSAHCEVPFKPNGRKPVLCSDCHRGGNAGSDRGGLNFDAPRPRKEHAPKPSGNAEVVAQLKELNQKMDVIITAIRGLR